MELTEKQISDISDGKCNGQTFWVCDLRFDNYANKPIRKVKPTEVTVRNNSETNEKIYYSLSHFIPKVGAKKVIRLYDNTGYRSRTGEPLRVFDNQIECENCYNELLKVAKKGFAAYIQRLTDNFNNQHIA